MATKLQIIAKIATLVDLPPNLVANEIERINKNIREEFNLETDYLFEEIQKPGRRKQRQKILEGLLSQFRVMKVKRTLYEMLMDASMEQLEELLLSKDDASYKLFIDKLIENIKKKKK